jgi:hypothetical protein
MKKARAKTTTVRGDDDMLPEYDFSRGRRNKYAARYAEGSNVVVLDPDVAAVFRNAGEVNAALRALASVILSHRPARARSRRSA